jgi:hypothetical protein
MRMAMRVAIPVRVGAESPAGASGSVLMSTSYKARWAMWPRHETAGCAADARGASRCDAGVQTRSGASGRRGLRRAQSRNTASMTTSTARLATATGRKAGCRQSGVIVVFAAEISANAK